MAEKAGLSARSLSRLFQIEPGTSPAEFVDGVRVEAARRALLKTAAPSTALLGIAASAPAGRWTKHSGGRFPRRRRNTGRGSIRLRKPPLRRGQGPAGDRASLQIHKNDEANTLLGLLSINGHRTNVKENTPRSVKISLFSCLPFAAIAIASTLFCGQTTASIIGFHVDSSAGDVDPVRII